MPRGGVDVAVRWNAAKSTGCPRRGVPRACRASGGGFAAAREAELPGRRGGREEAGRRRVRARSGPGATARAVERAGEEHGGRWAAGTSSSRRVADRQPNPAQL